MVAKLRVFQIYYSESSYKNCFKEFDWWHGYDNTGDLTPFFENTPIANLIELGEHKNSEYFGVFSHDIAQEISFKQNGKSFSPSTLLECMNTGADVYSFQKRRQQKNLLLQAENYHPHFVEYTTKILNEIGYDMPKKTSKIILFNHFIMKSELYERYYFEMLKPAMDVMSKMDELNNDAKYKRDHPDFTEQLGYNHYPYHPFICERLPSVWLEYNKELIFEHIF